jgi:hypothetical protein
MKQMSANKQLIPLKRCWGFVYLWMAVYNQWMLTIDGWSWRTQQPRDCLPCPENDPSNKEVLQVTDVATIARLGHLSCHVPAVPSLAGSRDGSVALSEGVVSAREKLNHVITERIVPSDLAVQLRQETLEVDLTQMIRMISLMVHTTSALSTSMTTSADCATHVTLVRCLLTTH